LVHAGRNVHGVGQSQHRHQNRELLHLLNPKFLLVSCECSNDEKSLAFYTKITTELKKLTKKETQASKLLSLLLFDENF
jgi:hypothetical protein